MLAQIKSQGYDGVILPRGDGQYDGYGYDGIITCASSTETSEIVALRAKRSRRR